MTFGENKSVVEEVGGVIGVEFESILVEEEDGEDFGDGGAGGGVPALGDMDSIDGIDSEVVGDVFVEGK